MIAAALAFGLMVWIPFHYWRKGRAARRSVEGRDAAPSEFTLDQLLLMKELVGKELNAIENRKQEIIDQGAKDGKTLSTEKVLKRVEELRSTYTGPDREQFVESVDRLVVEFRGKYGAEIPVDEAYRLLKGL